MATQVFQISRSSIFKWIELVLIEYGQAYIVLSSCREGWVLGTKKERRLDWYAKTMAMNTNKKFILHFFNKLSDFWGMLPVSTHVLLFDAGSTDVILYLAAWFI